MRVRRAGDEAVRAVSWDALWAAPQAGRASDLALDRDDLIETIVIPAHDVPQRLGYEEIRQKAAFDWPLVSCGVRLIVALGTITDARIVLGSVAPTPHRAEAAEQALMGLATDAKDLRARIDRVGELATQGATPLPGNAYKMTLVRTAVRRAVLRTFVPQVASELEAD